MPVLMHDFRTNITRRSFWALMVGVIESCKIVFRYGDFLFICSNTFAVGCKVYSLNAQRHGRTHRWTDVKWT